MIFSIPLLPAGRFADAFELVRTEAAPLQQRYRNLARFLIYWENTWLRNANVVSVHGCRFRTNNFVKSANRYLRERIGVHPTFWTFLGLILNKLYI